MTCLATILLCLFCLQQPPPTIFFPAPSHFGYRTDGAFHTATTPVCVTPFSSKNHLPGNAPLVFSLSASRRALCFPFPPLQSVLLSQVNSIHRHCRPPLATTESSFVWHNHTIGTAFHFSQVYHVCKKFGLYDIFEGECEITFYSLIYYKIAIRDLVLNSLLLIIRLILCNQY